MPRTLRTIRAVCIKDLRLALRERASTAIGLIVPINFLFLFSLFALTGGEAPIAVVMLDQGPLANQFVAALEQANSFQIHLASATEAHNELVAGRIVGVITVPNGFDAQLQAGQDVDLPVDVNNLNVDFTNDIRRAVPLSITSFYAHAFQGQVVVRASESDTQAQDTGYIPYLAISIVVVGVFIEGLLQSAIITAREYEDHTMVELVLAPAGAVAVTLGKVAAGFVLCITSGLLVILVVVFIVGVRPVFPLEVAAVAVLMSVPAVALGVFLGTLLKRRQAVIPLAIGSTLPLFFLSGPFGPPNWGATGLISVISPLTYAIALFQHAFHGYLTAQSSLATDLIVLVGFSVLTTAAAAVVLRQGIVP